ncbi:hypothetical protein [Mycolicibacterium gadium]|uniref:Uncharacterized protein n=1 Tax=Mycolicibacterium gadium TaxID=1794 RepID=A0ABT6GKQ9_MYCGU|nr:hypothetical protein [Mycolicibacterium gadium]MDG5481918.1 hypothetical protein [Mycolicibacterium gadium]
MPLSVNQQILDAVSTVYSTELGLPEDWTDHQRADFIAAEADKIAWMVRAEASTIGDRLIAELGRRSGGTILRLEVRTELMAAARVQAFDSVLSTELYELIADDTCDL